jgi:hypothetical protein
MRTVNAINEEQYPPGQYDSYSAISQQVKEGRAFTDKLYTCS